MRKIFCRVEKRIKYRILRRRYCDLKGRVAGWDNEDKYDYIVQERKWLFWRTWKGLGQPLSFESMGQADAAITATAHNGGHRGCYFYEEVGKDCRTIISTPEFIRVDSNDKALLD